MKKFDFINSIKKLFGFDKDNDNGDIIQDPVENDSVENSEITPDDYNDDSILFKLFEQRDKKPEKEKPEKIEFDEYSDISQRNAIKDAISKRIVSAKLRIMILIFAFLASVWFDILPEFFPKFTPVLLNKTAFVCVNAGLLLLVLALCITSVINGILNMFKSRCHSDSICVVPLIASIIQIAALYLDRNAVHNGVLIIAPYVIFLYIVNYFSKVFAYNRMFGNFTYLSRQRESFALKIIDLPRVVREISRSYLGSSVIVGSSGADSYDRFIELSSSADKMEISAKIASLFVYAAGLVVSVVSAISSDNAISFFRLITQYCTLITICLPFAGLISGQSVISKQAKRLRRRGVMLSGYAAVKKFSQTNAVIFDAAELYPKDTVTLVGIKTFGGERIDQALSDAAALVLDAQWPLAPIFDNIIDSNRKILPKIEATEVVSEHGISGWVNGRRIVIGSDELMKKYGIVPPSKDYEELYRLEDQKIVYLASKGELTAMFVVSYEADEKIAEQFKLLSRNGLSIIVRTSDPNVTANMMAKSFDIPKDSIKILSEESGREYDAEKKNNKVQQAYISHSGRSQSMLESVIACKKLYSGIALGNILMLAGSIITFLLMSFLMLYSGKIEINHLQFLIYQLFWYLVVMIAPRISTL